MSFINDKDDNYLQTSDIIAKTLYLGMFTNVLIPMGLLMVCYYISQNYRVANQVGEMGNSLFFVFAFLAIAQAVFAFWHAFADLPHKEFAPKARELLERFRSAASSNSSQPRVNSLLLQAFLDNPPENMIDVAEVYGRKH